MLEYIGRLRFRRLDEGEIALIERQKFRAQLRFRHGRNPLRERGMERRKGETAPDDRSHLEHGLLHRRQAINARQDQAVERVGQSLYSLRQIARDVCWWREIAAFAQRVEQFLGKERIAAGTGLDHVCQGLWQRRHGNAQALGCQRHNLCGRQPLQAQRLGKG